MKGQLLRKYHSLLISNCLEELENLMCEGFLRHFGKLLPLEESFTDWLVVKLRPLRKQKLSFATFHSHYLEEKIDKEFYIELLKTLLKMISSLPIDNSPIKKMLNETI